MADYGSNQYPPLPWEPCPDTVHGGLIARPHGGVSFARVYYAAYYPPHARWVWIASWQGRFGRDASEATEEEAKTAATIAYWDQVEDTPDWVQPAPPPPPPPLPADVAAFRKRIEDWIDSDPPPHELRMELTAFQFANPPIFSKEEDARAYGRILHALGTTKGG